MKMKLVKTGRRNPFYLRSWLFPHPLKRYCNFDVLQGGLCSFSRPLAVTAEIFSKCFTIASVLLILLSKSLSATYPASSDITHK